MKKALLLTLSILLASQAFSQNSNTYVTISDISYYPDSIQADEYVRSICKLDLYHPINVEDRPTIVWFHGGGLQTGEKYFPEGLLGKDICIVSVNYRLSPKVNAPDYLLDAAAAVAWTFNNIESYGGNKNKIFVSGHSAGGYLAAMIGLDKRWMSAYGIDADLIAGLMPLSGQMITHSGIRAESGIPRTTVVVDKYAPLYHVRKDAPPLLLMTGDRKIDRPARYEENAFLSRMMEFAGHEETKLYEFQGYGHGMEHPACPIMIKEITRICEAMEK